MIESIDCMQWEWKSFLTAQTGAYSGRKGRPTTILEAVVSHDTHVCHTFFGIPGAQNNLNVLGVSQVFERVIAGSASMVVFDTNDTTYTNEYYLADGINSRWSTFVKSMSKPRTVETKHYCKSKRLTEKMQRGISVSFNLVGSSSVTVLGYSSQRTFEKS